MPPPSALTKGVGNYLLLLGTSAIWGAQFTLNEFAITSLPPGLIAAGRTVIGFLTLFLLVALLPAHGAGQPPAKVTTKIWGQFFLIGLFEATAPFYLVAWGQERIDSNIAAILIGTVAIFTVLLSALFVRGQRLRFGDALGVALGFLGVVILIGPGALTGVLANLLGELAILGGALSFAISLLLINQLPQSIPTLVRARNILLCASIQIVPLTLVLEDVATVRPTWQAMLAVLALGTLCAGIVYILFVTLIDRAGPTFASFNGFLVPVFGVLFGALFLGETLKWTALAALGLIILGLAATHLHGKPAASSRSGSLRR